MAFSHAGTRLPAPEAVVVDSFKAKPSHVEGMDVALGAVQVPLPTLLFVHGAGHDQRVWDGQRAYFAARGAKVMTPDLPGHGRSELTSLTSIAAMAQWVVAQLDGEAPVALIGHSMGALVALEIAATAPQQVARLALLGALAPMPVAPVLLAAARTDRDAAHRMINAWSFAARLDGADRATLALAAENESLLQSQAPGVLHGDLKACNCYDDGLAAAARVSCPTLLLVAALDRMAPPRAGAALTAALGSRARTQILPDVGHAMLSEAPKTVSEALWKFVTGPPD